MYTCKALLTSVSFPPAWTNESVFKPKQRTSDSKQIAFTENAVIRFYEGLSRQSHDQMVQRNSTPTATTNTTFEDNRSSSESTMMTALIFLAVQAILIVSINCFVVFLVWKKKILRTPANICLTSLACLDFLSGSCAIPLIMACTILAEAEYSNIGPLCFSMDVVNRMLSIAGILHLLTIAVERYVVIVRHVRPDDYLSCKKYFVIVSAIWLIPSFTSLIQLSWVEVEDNGELQFSTQTEVIYDLICIFGFVCVPLIIIIIAYIKVFCVSRRHSKDIKKQTDLFASDLKRQKHRLKEKRATMIYAAMIGFYIIGWFPYFLLSLYYDLADGAMPFPQWLDTAFLFFRFSPPLVNPILYTFFKHDFKEVICSIRKGFHPKADSKSIELRCVTNST